MIKVAFAVVVLTGLALAAVQDDLGKIVSGAEKTKATKKKLTADQAKAIATACGLKPEDVETSVTILEGWAQVPDAQTTDKARVLGIVVTAKGPKGAIKIGVAVAADEDRIVNVKVLENKDDASAATADFYDQFYGFLWSGAIRKSPDDLKAMLAKSKDNKEAAALLEISVGMRRLGVNWNALVKKADKTSVPYAEEVAKIYDAAVKRVGDLAFLTDRQRKTLSEDLAKAAKTMRDVIPKLDGTDTAKKALAEMDNLCNRCHAPMRSRFIDQREKDGVGNGWLSPEVELVIPLEGSKELWDAVAKAIKKAVLTIRDAK